MADITENENGFGSCMTVPELFKLYCKVAFSVCFLYNVGYAKKEASYDVGVKKYFAPNK